MNRKQGSQIKIQKTVNEKVVGEHTLLRL